MLKKFITLLLSSFFLITGLSLQSCKNDDSAEKEAEEKRLLEQYIVNENITAVPTSSGLYYIEEVEGEGFSPSSTDWVEIKFSIRLVSSNQLVITTDSATAKNNAIYNSNVLYEPNRTPMSEITLKGLFEGISKMKAGGIARVIFPSKLGYGDKTSGNIPGYSSLIVDIELVNVITDIVSFERNKMNAYLVANNITDPPTSSGLVYHEILPGDGEPPITGKVVTYNYTGSLLNGKIFDSKSNVTVTIGYQQVAVGIEEGLKKMKINGSAKLIIPYDIAFGSGGIYKMVNNQYYIVVWPYSTVVYDVDITDIQDGI